jgi:extracellular elastinolytic metalloproteinase
MPRRLPVSRRVAPVAALVGTTLCLGVGVAALPSAQAAPHDQAARAGQSKASASTSRREASDKADYDSRAGGTVAQRSHISRAAAKAAARPPTERLQSSLGREAVVDMDGTTGTARMVARLDGYLTPPSRRPAAQVALRYVRAHLGALGLTASDMRTFRLRRDYVDISGTRHLSWTQSADGVAVFGNGLQAAVTSKGRLLTVGGSPVSHLVAPPAPAGKVSVSGRSSAIASARADVGEPTAAGPEDTARQVLFESPAGIRRAWQAITMSASRPMLDVVDAADGHILYRRDLSSDAVAPQSVDATVAAKPRPTPSTGLAFRYFPRHKPGGMPLHINFTKRGWLPHKAIVLRGNNSHAWADTNDDNIANANEEIPAKSPHSWAYRLKPFHLTQDSFCGHPYPCSWNPNKPFSWRTNRDQNATQVFFFVNNWHDHLRAAPIGFTEAAGNFQRVNATHKGKGGDAVHTQTDDGANTDHGLPDGAHVDNANMATPPDGQPPTMQMYLQHLPHTSYPNGDPFSPTNVGDEADTVYHEYTHGLSNRLVVDAAGNSTLGNVQAGAMGEAWSDWYAMDYLVAHGLQKDRPGPGNLRIFQYDGAGVAFDRTEPLDCKVGATTARCPGGATGHRGGYTYADYGKVIGIPEVHADGEIWSQTLWDLRGKLGSKLTESLVTRAMELSPSNPSMLDERNAILLADMAVSGGRHQKTIWRVFAHRGMGYFAGALNGNDTSPAASFRVPPTGTASATVRGTVTDSATGRPVPHALLTAFDGSGLFANSTTMTDANGRYTFHKLPVGRYPKFSASKAGYDTKSIVANVHAGANVRNLILRRDWSSPAGGARLVSSMGQKFGPCFPHAAIDQSLIGWEVQADLNGSQTTSRTPKSIVVRLPKKIDISEITIDPTSTCGDGASASTGAFSVQSSPDRATWTTVSSGSFVAADEGHANSIPLGAGTTGVRFLKFTIKEPLVLSDTATYGTNPCPGAFSGCDFEDVTSLEVYGS